uniref:Uncharacterized protein n=1 Tax=Oryza brachyantha TaxID=4533 RepID=J3N3P5_ORYBR
MPCTSHRPVAAVAEAFRCGCAENTLRSFLASSRNYTTVEGREKVLAVVGCTWRSDPPPAVPRSAPHGSGPSPKAS